MRIPSMAAALTMMLATPAWAQPVGASVGGLPAVTFAPASPPPGFVYETVPVRDVSTDPEPAQKPEKPVNFDLGFGTEAPLSVGGVASLEVYRVLFQAGVGVMPQAYAEAVDGALRAVGAYDQAVSQVVRNSVGHSFVLRTSVGFRPFEKYGFEMVGGYTLMTLGGMSTASELVNTMLVDGGAAARIPTELSGAIPFSATLHNVHASLGWRWLLANEHLVIRASLSYTQCVSAQVGVNLAGLGATVAALEGTVNQSLNSVIAPFLSTYGKAPTLGLSAAYRF